MTLIPGSSSTSVANSRRFESPAPLPGSSWSIPRDVEHAAEVLAEAVVIEVFSPVREDYLPLT